MQYAGDRRWLIVLALAAWSAFGLTGCKEQQASATARVIGTELRDGKCHYIVELEAGADMKDSAVSTNAGTGTLRFGPLTRGERRILALTAPSNGPCRDGVKAVVKRAPAGKVPAGWSADYGLLGVTKISLTEKPDVHQCLVLSALRISRPGPLDPVFTAFDPKGRALETRASGSSCRSKVGKGIETVYCATYFRTACDAMARVVATRGTNPRSERMHQAKRVIRRCDYVTKVSTPVHYHGQTPSWIGRGGGHAFLTSSRGVPKGYFKTVRPGQPSEVVGVSDSPNPCMEATQLVLQSVH